MNVNSIVWTGGLETAAAKPRRRWIWLSAISGFVVILLSSALGLWLVAAPVDAQATSWYWFQGHVFHVDAGDRFLAAIEHHDRKLFESAVSRSCGDDHASPCFTWRYDDVTFHRHWGHFVYRGRDGQRVSLWNVNRLLDGYLGPEETVQAWGFVYDRQGLVKDVL